MKSLSFVSKGSISMFLITPITIALQITNTHVVWCQSYCPYMGLFAVYDAICSKTHMYAQESTGSKGMTPPYMSVVSQTLYKHES